MAQADQKFIQNGIQFECQGSGKCCTSRGAYGFVYLTTEDRKRFAKFFGVTVSEFRRKHCDEEDGNVFLRNPESDCTFLQGKRCSVYEARPNQCRTWPFWPENLNAKAWNKEVTSFCPGVGKGRVYSEFEIKAILKTKT